MQCCQNCHAGGVFNCICYQSQLLQDGDAASPPPILRPAAGVVDLDVPLLVPWKEDSVGEDDSDDPSLNLGLMAPEAGAGEG